LEFGYVDGVVKILEKIPKRKGSISGEDFNSVCAIAIDVLWFLAAVASKGEPHYRYKD